jgi:hypothetical protein
MGGHARHAQNASCKVGSPIKINEIDVAIKWGGGYASHMDMKLTVNGEVIECFDIVMDIDMADYPDFCDACIIDASKKVGDKYVALTPEELESIPSDDCQEAAHDYIH